MDEDPEQRYRHLRLIGSLGSIPVVLLSGLLVGYFLGSWLDGRLRTTPWLMLLFIGLGLAAGVRSTIQLLRRAQKDIDRL